MTGPGVIAARMARDVVTVRGDDAAAYLQGQLSQDVAGLAVGESAPAFVLAPQGKVEGWGRVHRTAADAFEIDVDLGAGAAWDARLRRFLLRTKAEIVVEEGVAGLAVRGATAFGGLPLTSRALVGSDLLRVAADEWPTAVPADAVEASPLALEVLRIRAGIPVWGAEIDPETIPATLGQWVIDASVSFTKGCYTGQELVARIDSRGGNVPRRLVGLELAGPAPATGSTVEVGGEAVATITSSTDDPGRGAVALLFLPRSVELAPDGIDAVVDGREARVRPLPLPA